MIEAALRQASGIQPASFPTLADSGLGTGADEIDRLFEPFVARGAAAGPAARARDVARRRRNLVKATARRLALGWRPAMQRCEATVLREYNKAWWAIGYGTYSLEAEPRQHTHWEWRGRRLFASVVGATRFRQLLLIPLPRAPAAAPGARGRLRLRHQSDPAGVPPAGDRIRRSRADRGRTSGGPRLPEAERAAVAGA